MIGHKPLIIEVAGEARRKRIAEDMERRLAAGERRFEARHKVDTLMHDLEGYVFWGRGDLIESTAEDLSAAIDEHGRIVMETARALNEPPDVT